MYNQHGLSSSIYELFHTFVTIIEKLSSTTIIDVRIIYIITEVLSSTIIIDVRINYIITEVLSSRIIIDIRIIYIITDTITEDYHRRLRIFVWIIPIPVWGIASSNFCSMVAMCQIYYSLPSMSQEYD